MNRSLDIFRALADPTRLRIFALLRQMELSVGELAQTLGQSQPRVSRHVKILADAGLTARRREGSWVFLTLGQAHVVAPLIEALDAWSIGATDPWQAADAARLAAVRGDRAAAAERYFDQHAEQWDAIRSLYVAETEVEAAMRALLDGEPIGRLVDIGTGTGRMLALFGHNAESATGVDRSPQMLRLARAKLAEAGLDSAELRQGDMYAVPLVDGSADTVVLHQLLHFAQVPEAAITEAGRLLAADGRLLIADFASHEREELRSEDAHARLGFADDQIRHWFADAGLSIEAIEELKGGELTVKLWLGRRREQKMTQRKAA
ncbi:ArsR/SmtB family transcription factor [Sphingomonas cavernae]|uniref:Methyltransferase domain-containing protein n=1 Tax=Sphingomonas cavernae TaxID=2320861 RepID=A0A418WK80_9SPHN|nr:metalloregulator ArsR/SmtB family transcription factor [Sphingomonas cavernae]RJF90446.1 methyltransferase domain-containing protein [Sphingomonas cavernae]